VALIGIDIGTSFVKGAILDLDTHQITHIQRSPFPPPLVSISPLYREYDAQVILDAVRGLVHDLAPFAAPCEGLVMCSQMHGLVFTSPKGEARSSLTTWQDQRVLMPHPSGAGTYFDVLMSRLSANELRQLGNELRVGLPIGNLFWAHERGELPADDTLPVSLPDFVLANLCNTMPTTEIINAQSHGALNLETSAWHQDVLRKLGLDKVRWPEIKRHGERVGTIKVGEQEFPCYTPIGDFQCALLGALLREGELSVNISTGSQVSLLRPQVEFGNFQTRPFFDGDYLITVTTIPAGRALTALIGLLTELATAQGVQLSDPWEYITRAAEAVRKPDMRVHLAFYSTPVGDHGEIANMREVEMTVGHLFRAAFENMAQNYLTCAQRLSPEAAWQQIAFSGGLAQKIGLLRQIISEQFGVPYRMAPHTEDTMFGLLALGMAFTGRTASVREATQVLAKIG
jgi:sugar (pentulose or hexulose) kinase